ncbi:MAG: hypothetical protein U9R15_04535 [Chloroflexota bacterium]|nr:hypothetical protein [Chloroflexota bacterium]
MNKQIELPFDCTESAIKYGREAKAEEIKKLAEFKETLRRKSEEAMKKNDLQKAMDWAVKAQFCREAIESYALK